MRTHRPQRIELKFPSTRNHVFQVRLDAQEIETNPFGTRYFSGWTLDTDTAWTNGSAIEASVTTSGRARRRTTG